MKRFALFCSLFFLSACAGNVENYQSAMNGFHIEVPKDYTRFQQCHGYGCRIVDTISFTKKDWRAVEKAFQPKPKTAEAERKSIAKAIGIIETKIGKMNGTSADVYGTFAELGNEQLDCVDESINTTTYLHLLAQGKLLKFNAVNSPETRVPFGRWPHRTATIRDKKSDERFAVDSWFYDNGHPATIVPLKDWKSGWNPKDFKG